MAACREAHDADAVRLHAKLLGASPHRANGPLCILQRSGMAVAFATMAVVADEGSDSERIQPADDLVSLVVHRQAAIAATWTDDDPTAGSLIRIGKRNDQRRLVLRLVPQLAWSAGWPEQLRFRLGRLALTTETKRHD